MIKGFINQSSSHTTHSKYRLFAPSPTTTCFLTFGHFQANSLIQQNQRDYKHLTIISDGSAAHVASVAGTRKDTGHYMSVDSFKNTLA